MAHAALASVFMPILTFPGGRIPGREQLMEGMGGSVSGNTLRYLVPFLFAVTWTSNEAVFGQSPWHDPWTFGLEMSHSKGQGTTGACWFCPTFFMVSGFMVWLAIFAVTLRKASGSGVLTFYQHLVFF